MARRGCTPSWERPAQLDELKADEVISAEEHARRRTRILGEL